MRFCRARSIFGESLCASDHNRRRRANVSLSSLAIVIILIALVALSFAVSVEYVAIQRMTQNQYTTGPATATAAAFYITYTTTVSEIVTVPETQAPLTSSVDDFLGDWANSNPNTNGILRFQILSSGSGYDVHVWGACSPPCDYGLAPLIFYTGSITDHTGVLYANAVYNFGFETTYLTLQFLSPGTLQLLYLTHFTDNSGRADYSSSETFLRS
jgi:hypothetical protein